MDKRENPMDGVVPIFANQIIVFLMKRLPDHLTPPVIVV
jgi:hypothetical protein